MSDERFDLRFHIDKLARCGKRRLAFQANSPAEFYPWQRQLCAVILRLLALEGPTRRDPVKSGIVATKERQGYTEEKCAVGVGEGGKAPVYSWCRTVNRR